MDRLYRIPKRKDVIEQQGERLIEVAGIGPKRASKIRLAWSDQEAIREIMVFLQSHSVGTSRAVRIGVGAASTA